VRKKSARADSDGVDLVDLRLVHLVPHKGFLLPPDAAKAGTLIRGDLGTSMTIDLEVCTCE
jgi:hypothetical protein